MLKHAARLFLERGFHGTSVEAITNAANVTKGAFYWHFNSKLELLEAIINEFETDFLDGLIQDVTHTSGNALQKLHRLTRYNAVFAYYNPELCISFTTVSAEFSGTGTPIEKRIKAVYDKYRSFLANLIRTGQEENVFRRDLDTEMLARIVIAFHDGILLEWWRNKEEISGRDYVKTYESVLLKGMMQLLNEGRANYGL